VGFVEVLISKYRLHRYKINQLKNSSMILCKENEDVNKMTPMQYNSEKSKQVNKNIDHLTQYINLSKDNLAIHVTLSDAVEREKKIKSTIPKQTKALSK